MKNMKLIVFLTCVWILSINTPIIKADTSEAAASEYSSYKNFPTRKNEIERMLISSRSIFLIEDKITENIAVFYMKEMLYLDKLKPGKTIHLYISATGGLGCITLANFIRKLKSPVNTYAIGNCWSGATMLLAAGTGKRYAFKNSRVGIHVSIGNNEEPGCKSVNQKMYEDFWRSVAKLPEKYYPFDGEVKICFTLEQALEYKVIDEIIDINQKIINQKSRDSIPILR